MIVTFGNWSDKNDPWWTVFYHELLRVRIDYGFRLLSIFRLLPISILITLEGKFSKKIIDVAQVVKRLSKRFFTIDGFGAMESGIGILHAIHRFNRLRFLESWLTSIDRITALRVWAVVRHFRTNFGLIKVIKISKLAALRFMSLTAIVLKSTCPFSYPQFLLYRILSQFLDRFQILVIYSSQVIILKLNMLEFGVENVHFATIFENDFIIQLTKCLGCRFRFFVLDEGFPDFGLFEDEYFDNLAKRDEKLIKVVMSDNIAITVINTDKEYRSLICWLIYHIAV